jgi:thiosulfate reductase cytochrome b subunit
VEDSISYNAVQRLTYLGVVFVLTPLIVVTGLAMSPAVTAAVPVLPAIFGGHQSSRTIHFIVADLLVLFLIVHLAMLVLVGFTLRVGSMITGAVRTKMYE